MAQLSSPGASITVSDESFYTPAAPGTVPLIIVASAENKANAAGTGTAPGTLKANAGNVYLLTSQMDLGTTFGIPYFQTDASNNPVHGGEINEYGLQAAYSFLGVSNRAYVVRADLDTSQLVASATSPSGAPADGTYWLDTASTNFGVFEWNADPVVSGGQKFVHKEVTVITDPVLAPGGEPLPSYGTYGDYTVVATSDVLSLWHKTTGWFQVGSSGWTSSIPAATGTAFNADTNGFSLTINGSIVSTSHTLSALVDQINVANIDSITAGIVNDGYLALYTPGTPIEVVGTAVPVLGLGASGTDTYTFNAPAFQASAHTSVPLFKATDGTPRPSGSVWVKTTPVNLGANWTVKFYNQASSSWIQQTISQLYGSNEAAIYGLDPAGGGINLAVTSVYVKYDANIANFTVFKRKAVGSNPVTTSAVTTGNFPNLDTFSIAISESSVNTAALTSTTITFAGGATAAATALNLVTAVNASSVLKYTTAKVTGTAAVTFTHSIGGEMIFAEVGPGTAVADLFGSAPVTASLWASTIDATVAVPASEAAPTTDPVSGTLWYNSVIDEIDIMIHDGNNWVGYLNGDIPALNGTATDPAGPIVSATQPTAQSDNSPLANGDLWISTADLENFPTIYKFSLASKKWVLVDKEDQTTEDGILFHDARWSKDGMSKTPGTIVELLSTDFVDFDAPDPALYPKGMLLWNLRRSGNNVLRYAENYVDTNAHNLRYGNDLQTDYFPSLWISEAPNTTTGVGQFGRKAQRAVVVKALNALIESNQQIRDEDSRVFNLISCPGYLETAKPLVALNMDRGQLSFIVGDSPARLSPDATTLSNWGQNVNNATGDGEDGLITTDANLAVYYPWGFTTDLLGNNVVVPPSHIMLRTIALSDNVSYPWFAPAGTRRGGVTNASSVGYVNPTTGEFNTVALNTGQRDTLAAVHVNPITYLGGVGLVAYGQKTRQLVASSLDRINVARLVIYLRYQLNQIAKPYIFEPNDQITRNEIKQQIESMLLELTGQRALYDFLVVCDTSNNTPARIDRNELHVDIAIEPVKAVEFIYIPLRLENTGAIKGLGA